MNKKYHRRSIRLKNYDYSQSGAYFVTVCTHQKKPFLGNILNGVMKVNKFGKAVEKEWLKTQKMRENVELDECIIMPNHFHGIIVIKENNVQAVSSRGVLQYAPTNGLQSPSETIGAIVRGFKSAVTKRINELRGKYGTSVWQRNYYEHIIRNDKEFKLVREYIINNPLRWQYDQENPDGKPDEKEKEFWRFLPDNVGAFN
ncbi:transposase [candidate division WOR-3 bacterium]|nr:transposase [candidate division WOR-3 bacterium]